MTTKNAQIQKLQKDLTETELLLGSAQRKATEFEQKYLAEKQACEERGNMLRRLETDCRARTEKIQSALIIVRTAKSRCMDRVGQDSSIALAAVLGLDVAERALLAI